MTTLSANRVVVVRGGTPALSGVTIAVGGGEFVAVVGPNGAGKTTLLGCLAGEVRPTSGAVTVDGADPADLTVPDRARARAYLAQSDRTDVPYDVDTVVGFGTHLSVLDAPERRELVDQSLATMQIEQLASRAVSSLSGGERRRVAIARILAQDNGVLLLDEPTDSLDLAHADLVMSVAAGRARSGDVVVTSSHDLNLAARHADRVIVLRSGQIAAEGTAHDVFTEALLSEVYECRVRVIAHPVDGKPVVFL
ncbi:MAG: ABC transporter ATP-binding protein [Acidimicrobiia bacterium]